MEHFPRPADHFSFLDEYFLMAKRIELPALEWASHGVLKFSLEDKSTHKNICLTLSRENFIFRKRLGAVERRVDWYPDDQVLTSVDDTSKEFEKLLQDLLEKNNYSFPSCAFENNKVKPSIAILIGKLHEQSDTSNDLFIFLDVFVDQMGTTGEYKLALGAVQGQGGDTFSEHIKKAELKAPAFSSNVIDIEIKKVMYKFFPVNGEKHAGIYARGTKRPKSMEKFYNSWDKDNATYKGLTRSIIDPKVSVVLHDQSTKTLTATTNRLDNVEPKELKMYLKRKVSDSDNGVPGKAPRVVPPSIINASEFTKQRMNGINDFHPRDPEPDILREGRQSNCFSTIVSLAVLCQCIKNISSSVGDFVKGMMAITLFNNLKWRVEEPAPVPLQQVSYRNKSTFDLDQASLHVVDVGPNLKMNESNQSFLEYYYYCALQQIFAGHLPSGINKLNFSRFSNPKVRAKGGHTFLPDRLKEKFLLITDGVGHLEEVLRISVALLSCKRGSDTTATQQHADNYFDSVEKALLEGYDGMKQPERIFTAMTLVAKFLNERLPGVEGYTNNNLLRVCGKKAVRGVNQLQCHGGALLHVLTTFQLAALEEWNRHRSGTKSAFTVSVSLESYGGKTRGEQSVVCMEDTIEGRKEMVEHIAKGITPKKCSAASVVAGYSTFCAQELNIRSPTHNNMYWGVGATYWGVDQDNYNSPLYAAFNWSELEMFVRGLDGTRYSHSHHSSSNDPLDVGDDPQDVGGSSDYEYDDWENDELPPNEDPVDVISADIFDSPLQDRLKYQDVYGNKWDASPYVIWGGLLPVNLQPVTFTRDHRSTHAYQNCTLVKVQHYSKQGRYPIGECNTTDRSRATVAATACLQQLSIGTIIMNNIVSKEYRYDHHAAQLDDVLNYLRMNCDQMRMGGNAARLELGFKSIYFDDHTKAFEEAIEMHLSMMESCLHFYDIVEPLATCMEFFGNGLRQRSDFAVRCYNKNSASIDSLQEMFTCIIEEVSWWRRWYNGRRLFSSAGIICKKLGVLASRPVVAVLPTLLEEQLLKEVPSFQKYNETFQIQLQIFFQPSVAIIRSSRLPLIVAPCPTGKVCKTCGWVYEDRDTFFRHPCTAALTEDSIVDVTSVTFQTQVGEWYSYLTDEQQLLVDTAAEGYKNIFLTGYAGCGKTLALRCAIARLRIKYGTALVVSVCYTKAAAMAVRGDSLHSLLCCTNDDDLQKITREDILTKLTEPQAARKLAKIVQMHTLVIDEVSMLHGNCLQVLHEVFSILRYRPGVPFGGIQIILCGDILQIPPLSKDNNSPIPNYFFFASIWSSRESAFHVMYLKHIHRQTAHHELLNRIRIGCPTDDDIAFLNEHCGARASREVIEFLIESMYQLNSEELVSKEMEHMTKAKKYWFNQRGGYVIEKGNSTKYHQDNVTVEALKEEINSRPFAGNTNRNKTLLEHFAQHFVVGLENAEGRFIGEELQKRLLVERYNMRKKVYSSRGIDRVIKFTADEDACRTWKDAVNIVEKDPTINAPYLSPINTDYNSQVLTGRADELLLYEGQIVVLSSNRIDRLAANNTTGIIIHLKVNENNPTMLDEVHVQLLGADDKVKQPVIIVKRDWKVVSPNGTINQFRENIIVVRNQFPLMPARWSTGYSLQGMTLKDLILIFNNIRNTADKYGLFYVLISRMIDISMFCTVREILKEDISVNRAAEWFDRYHAVMADRDAMGRPIMHVVNYDEEFVKYHFGLARTAWNRYKDDDKSTYELDKTFRKDCYNGVDYEF